MKFFSKKYLPVLFSFFLLFFFFPTPIHAQTEWTGVCVGTRQFSDVPTIKGFECLFANILQVIIYIAGIACLVMFIVGGYKYLFSSNDPKKVAVASSTLTMAIIGLVGIIASYFILKFIQEFTGTNVTEFNIGIGNT